MINYRAGLYLPLPLPLLPFSLKRIELKREITLKDYSEAPSQVDPVNPELIKIRAAAAGCLL